MVERVRRERGGKVGHAGTLDPFATGLLVVLLGRATRLQRYLLPLPKTYRAVARLGWRSTTGDPDGELTDTGNMPAQLALRTGTITQRVPMTSAVRVEGERLYKKAHRGESVETPERDVQVYRAELVGEGDGTAEFEIECSSGTYVRTLVETLRDAYCAELRRVAIGPFRIEDAGEDAMPVEEALSFLPARKLSETEAGKAANGVAIVAGADPSGFLSRSGKFGETSGSARLPSPTPRRLTHNGELIAIARVEGELLKPEVVLKPASD